MKNQGAVHAFGQVHVMGGDEGGKVFFAHQLNQFIKNSGGGRLIQVSCGLVRKEYLQAGWQSCPYDGDSLLLTAGKACGAVGGSVHKAYFFQ